MRLNQPERLPCFQMDWGLLTCQFNLEPRRWSKPSSGMIATGQFYVIELGPIRFLWEL